MRRHRPHTEFENVLNLTKLKGRWFARHMVLHPAAGVICASIQNATLFTTNSTPLFRHIFYRFLHCKMISPTICVSICLSQSSRRRAGESTFTGAITVGLGEYNTSPNHPSFSISKSNAGDTACRFTDRIGESHLPVNRPGECR